MKLLNLLLVVLLFACNDDSTDTPASKEPTNIVVEMEPTASNMTDVPAHTLFKPIKNTAFGKTENIKYYWSRTLIKTRKEKRRIFFLMAFLM